MDEAKERRFPCVSMLRNNIITISWLSLVSPAVVYSTHISHLSNPSTLLNLSATKSVLIKKCFQFWGYLCLTNNLQLYDSSTTLRPCLDYTLTPLTLWTHQKASEATNERIHFILCSHFIYMLHACCSSEWVSGKGLFLVKVQFWYAFICIQVKVSNSHFKLHVFWSRLRFFLFSFELLASLLDSDPLLILSSLCCSYVSMPLLLDGKNGLVDVCCVYSYVEYGREHINIFVRCTTGELRKKNFDTP